MERIIKWLQENNIEFTQGTNPWHHDEMWIVITLEKDCVWINGYGEPMKWDRKITIKHCKGGMYLIVETTGYSMSHTLGQSTRKERAIQILAERLGA